MYDKYLELGANPAGITDHEVVIRMKRQRECELCGEGLTPSEREKAHAEIEAKIAEFLAAGGAIEKVDSGTCALR